MKKLLASLRDFIQKLPLGRLHLWTQLGSKPFKSRSSYGEDALVNGVLKRYKFLTQEDFPFSYLDIGAFKPIKSSNTYFLYRKGYSGTAVEPNSDLKKLWRGTRPRDKFRTVACGTGEDMQLYFFGTSAESNTLDLKFSEKITAHQNLGFHVKQVKSESLDKIIENHKSHFPGDFFLDLDIEGLDFFVLNDFSFAKNKRPFLILIEAFVSHSIERRNLEKLMLEKDYVLIGRTVISALYADSQNRFMRELLTAEY